jgi:hypothetical protein
VDLAARQRVMDKVRDLTLIQAILCLFMVVILGLLVEVTGVPKAFLPLALDLFFMVTLLVLGALMVWLRRAVSRDPAGLGLAVKVGRKVGVVALVIAVVSGVGAVVAFATSEGYSQGVVWMFVGMVFMPLVNTYGIVRKLRRP